MQSATHVTRGCKVLRKHVGVRMNNQQLLLLAHQRVAGAEMWVQHELGIQTDIPDLAV